jgi:hypothetical protein
MWMMLKKVNIYRGVYLGGGLYVFFCLIKVKFLL